MNTFRDLRIHRTHGATGILLYVSLFEREIVVLADEGIASQIPAETWDGVRDLLRAGLKKGDVVAAFEPAIAECGRILSEKFPRCPDDADELPNTLVLRSACPQTLRRRMPIDWPRICSSPERVA